MSVLFATISLASCQKSNPVLKDNHLHRDDEFGGAFIDISIPNFNKLGFKYGDSLSLDFSNGVHYDDIGYYSGYYVAAGQELVVAYQCNQREINGRFYDITSLNNTQKSLFRTGFLIVVLFCDIYVYI